ncbi:MAG: hypothetical protein GY739_13870 [Mesoflavibacter sp.]|nr:hypothetical protein [Mesoflavibacter sp.]
MIKFFRKIRQKMLTENRFGKYLIYAIGEIVLVVIGILIALWINNNNIKNHNKEKERLGLIEIRDNLISDTLQLDDNLKRFKNRQGLIMKSMKLLSKNEFNAKDKDSLLFHFIYAELYENAIFKSNSVGFTNMISSGNIDLLSNNELRKKLSEYYLIENDNIGAYAYTLTISRDFQNYLSPLMTNNWSAKKIFGIDIPLEKEFDITKLQSAQTFSYLSQLFFTINTSTEASMELKKDITTLIELTNKELDSFEK